MDTVEVRMDENKERTKGKLEELGGNIKQGFGKLTGNEDMEAEGHAQERRGEERQARAKTIGRTKGIAQETKGHLKQGLGNLAGNELLEAEGKVDELQGEARQRANE
jgi:uncharacterized protein YjbJ (UPF0337 family)